MSLVLSPSVNLKNRSFLKWAGGKLRLMGEINRVLPRNKACLVEPFVGAGSVFLNSHFEHYILGDINPDLINLFNCIKLDVEMYIQSAQEIFDHPQANSADFYYQQRQAFNQSQDSFQRSVLFLYLNRFGFNGLCRYNSQNEFNVPFGRYKKHYFPEKELRFFAQKAQRAQFFCGDFQQTFQLAGEDCVIYCDPPYAPLQQNSNFTGYAGNDFTLEHQQQLAELARQTLEQRQIEVVISNHYTSFTREIYQGAKIKRIKVQRSISQSSSKRIKVDELIAHFKLRTNRQNGG